MKVVLRGELMNICVDLFYLKGLYVHMQVYITQLLTNGTQHFPPTPFDCVLHVFWKKMT